MVDIMSVVIAITFAIWVYFVGKDTLKTNKKFRDEMDIRIEFFKNNTRLTDELENLWTAVAYDKYGIYMKQEEKKGENDNEHMDL